MYQNAPDDFQTIKLLSEKYNLNSSYFKSEQIVEEYRLKYLSRFPNNKAHVLLLLAISYKYQGDYEKAAFHYLIAEDEFKKQKDFNGLIDCGAEIVEFYRKIVKFEFARKRYYKYCFIAKQKGVSSPRIWNKLYNRYAAVLNEMGQHQLSINFSEKAILEAKKIKDNNLLAISFNEIAFSLKNLYELKDYDQINRAALFYTKAYNLWFKAGYLRDAIKAKMDRINLLTHNGLLDPELQLKGSLEVIDLIDKYHVDYPKIASYETIRSYYQLHAKDYKRAFEYERILTDHRIKEIVSKSESDVINIQEKYQNAKLSEENQKIEEEAEAEKEKARSTRFQFLLALGVLVFVVIALLTLYFLWIRLRKVNRLLVKRNEQKTLLVQEIHHRVKNNLQFVRSILEMQRSANSGNSKTDLEDVSRRIEAMSLVHEMLYIEDEKMTVSVKDYLTRLMDLSNNFYLKNESYHVNLDIEDIEMTVDKVVSLGIICTELLTNSVKHAFPTAEAPVFSIKLKVVEGQIKLTVADNGQEKSTKRATNSQSLGMRLIDIFSRQLGGNSSVIRDSGYTFLLEFKI